MTREHQPCGECPFRRDVRAGICAEKSSHPGDFIGQIFGPFFLPCHRSAGFDRNPIDPSLRQCPGAAVFRSNVGAWDKVALPAALLRLPADRERYFGTVEEFVAHHTGCTLEEARVWLAYYTPEFLAQEAMLDAMVRVILLPAGAEKQSG